MGNSKPLLSFPPWNFRILRYETEKSTQNIPPGRALLSHPSRRPYVGSPIFVGSRPARVKTGPMTGPMTGEVDSSNLAACLTSDKYRNRDKNDQKCRHLRFPQNRSHLLSFCVDSSGMIQISSDGQLRSHIPSYPILIVLQMSGQFLHLHRCHVSAVP